MRHKPVPIDPSSNVDLFQPCQLGPGIRDQEQRGKEAVMGSTRDQGFFGGAAQKSTGVF